MSREELISIGNKLISSDVTEEEIQALYERFNKNVPHPDGANLFYYPENYDANKDDIATYHPTVEEVVDKALSYKPFVLR